MSFTGKPGFEVVHVSGALLLQSLRIPLLVALLAVAAAPAPGLLRAFARVELDAALYPWLVMVASGFAFVALATWRRMERHPPSLLAVEGLVAALVGLIPPLAWVQWFGVGRLPDLLGVAHEFMFIHALGISWLVVVVATAIRQARGAQLRARTDLSR